MPTYKIDLKWYHSPSPLATANEFIYDLITIYGEKDTPLAAYNAAKDYGETLFGKGKPVVITVTEQQS